MKRVVVAVLLTILALPALAVTFPKTGLYANTTGNGWPIIKADGSQDTAVMRRVSRYQLLTLNATPFFDLRPGIVDSIRALNPTMKIVSYDLYGQRFFFATLNTQWKAAYDVCNRIVGGVSGFLYALDGTQFAGAAEPWPNFGNATIGASMDSVLFAYSVKAPWHGDGVFLDIADGDASGLHSYDTGSGVDWARAGFASASAFDAARRSRLTTLAASIHAAHAGQLVIGNGTIPDALAQTIWDGAFFENWPNARGFAPGITAYQAAGNYAGIACEGGPASSDGTQYQNPVLAQVRFGLGSACMGSGYGFYHPLARLLPASGSTYLDWWYDEYAVNAAGVADTIAASTGWLGDPVAAAVIDSRGGMCRQFQNGVVLVNPSFLPMRFKLGAPYHRRIRGVVDPAGNNGRVERMPVVPPQSALFLQRIPGL